MSAPCYKCNDRVLGCHGDCSKYKEYKDHNESVKRASYEHKNIVGAHREAVARMTHKRATNGVIHTHLK